MGETLSEKTYGLTHEDKIIAHHLLVNTTKKTPYQLDLEVKDRKPDIVPKVGDKVKIKSREWYEKWKDIVGDFAGTRMCCSFTKPMSKHCGKIKEVAGINSDGAIALKNCRFWWHPEFFEEVYPQGTHNS